MSDNNYMDKDAYIEQLEKEIVELKKRIEELERLLGINSKNPACLSMQGLRRTHLCTLAR